jgi:hypothetical protein
MNFRRAWIAGCVGAGALFAAAPAHGATTIGSSLASRANLTIACGVPGDALSICTVAQIQLGDRPVTAPTDGVVVRWRMRSASSGTARLRILRPAGDGKFEGAGTSAPVAMTSPGEAGTDRSYSGATRLPVLQGDYIGLDRERRAGAVYAQRSGSLFDVIQFDEPLPDGQREGPDTSFEGAELLVNADIEPDKDGDGYGDETQDNCPTIANDQTDNPCPSEVFDPGIADGDPGADDRPREFRRHKAKKRKRKKRRGSKRTADRFQGHKIARR